MRHRISLLAMLCIVGSFIGCKKDDDDDPVPTTTLDEQLGAALDAAGGAEGKSYFVLPNSTDFGSIPQDPNNPITAKKVRLGQLLYHETGLATNPREVFGLGTYSCASCHFAAAGFQAGRKQGIGEGGSGIGLRGEGREPDPNYLLDSLDVQPIRTPTAMNGAYQELMLWNGQFGGVGGNIGTEANWTVGTPKETNNLGYEGLETQAIAGLKVHRMESDSTLIHSTTYKSMFDAAFPAVPAADRYDREHAGLAVAAYERTILANEAPFQLWLRGNTGAMTDQEKEGALLFFGKANCVACHTGPALNSMAFYAIGMNDLDGNGIYGTDPSDSENLGRGGFTGNSTDNYKFKVPQLYNLVNSPFYGHGGNFTTVQQVVEYKNAGVAQNATVPAGQLAAAFKPLNLTATEVANLTKFIENGLRDPELARYEPDALPSGNCFPNNDTQSRVDLGCN